MKPLLLDLNIILDVILERAPGVEPASALWAAIENGRRRGVIPAHGLTTIFYLLERARGAAFARRGVERLISVFGVAPIDEAVVRRALGLGWPDFGDAVCAAAAESAGCEVIVTRDPDGFPDSPVQVIDPAGALRWILGASAPS